MAQKMVDMRRAPWLAALALFAVVAASQAEWVWISLYFQTQSAGDIVFAFACYALATALGTAALTLALGNRIARALLHAATVIMVCLALFNGLREAGYIQHAAPLLLKAGATLFALTAAWLATAKMRQEAWARIYPATIIACPIFVFSPWMIAHNSASAAYWPTQSSQAAAKQPTALPRQNTVVLLLDELSADAAGPIVARLREQGLALQVSDLKPAGSDTINVIPAIWLHEDFTRAAPCGPTQLCSGGNVLDFSRIRASSDDIDVVGFYHQYCAMQGLRSCSFFAFPHKPALLDLTCELFKKPRLSSLGCLPSVEERQFFTRQRTDLQRALMEAPFWQHGGILYGHLLQPHPLMGASDASLQGEYADNIADSAALVGAIAQKAQARFGKDFRLVIFSDHPLRPQIWCANSGFYREERCKPEASQLSAQVPLIVAAPGGMMMPAINSNEQVFDLLYSR